ncbi:MAG: FAD-dependent oxidoreductase [Lachnospiraceae bacterium]|nr:FAD-dependent oxidoreductase [Lachnospiraceae bacterium]
MNKEGGINWLLNKIHSMIKGPKSAEVGIATMVSLTDMAIANNTVSIILDGPIARGIAEEYKVDPRRSASLLDLFSCDMVLWGIGMRPDTSLAAACGVKLGELGGVCVDDRMRTNVPHIYACGDCVESVDKLTGKAAMHLFWEPSQRGGMTAGRNAAGEDCIFSGSLGIYLTHKGGISIAALGKTEAELNPGCGLILEDRREAAETTVRPVGRKKSDPAAADGIGRTKTIYRRLLFEDGYLCGVQLLNTLDDIDLFFDTIQKNALRRDGKMRLQKPVEGVESMSVTDAVRAMRKERRTVTVYGLPDMG